MPTDTNDPRRPDRARHPEAGPASRPVNRPASRKGFQKDRATLLLLTLTLGLGLGTAARFVQRSDQARTATVPTAGTTQAQSSASGPYQNQRVVVLPQRSYAARATSRMS
ncbi:MAG TPA: hypothetical protein VKB31_09210 [Trueperaceae bacterium]|nr:hypothetical protein [Trueperaceae bacterium]